MTDWAPLLAVAGLEIEGKDEVPMENERSSAMYVLWLQNMDAIRAEVGDEAASALEAEARSVPPTLSNRRTYLVVGRKPT